MLKVGIITASDKGSRGEREDLSAEVIRELVQKIDGEVKAYDVLPDERELLRDKLLDYCDYQGLDLVLTTGGTGFSPRDITPEATLDVIERQTPGLTEAMRAESIRITPRGMLSREAAGIRGQTLIINLPGSPKAVRECLEVVLPSLVHGIEILQGTAGECASEEK